MKTGVWSVKGKRCGPRPISVRGGIGIKSVCAVSVIITGNGVLGIGCIVTIIVDAGKARVAIHETNHTLGVAIKGSVLSARFALVPGERCVRGPLPDQQRPRGGGRGGRR